MVSTAHRSVLRAIALTLLVCGTLDITDALVYYGLLYHVPAMRLLQGIASHLIGRSAYSGGVRYAILGLAMHYLIAAFWICLFIVAAQRLTVLSRRPVLCGALYGLLIYGVMNFLVLPLTRNARPLSPLTFDLLNGVLALVLFMGIAVALLNRRFAPLPSRA